MHVRAYTPELMFCKLIENAIFDVDECPFDIRFMSCIKKVMKKQTFNYRTT